MLRKLSLLLLAILIGSVTHAQNLKSIRIVSVPLYISTPYQISCNHFDESFDQDKKEIFVNKRNVLKDVQGLLKHFKSKILNGIDVRGEVILTYYSGIPKLICFDQFGHFFVKGSFYENKPLFNFLLKHHFIDPYGN